MTAAFPLGIEFRPSNKKEQILYGALEVIADLGLSGLSHRAVAERAGVPLGSTTYHFSSIEEIQLSAYELFKEMARNSIDQLYESSVDALKIYLHSGKSGRQELIDSVVLYSNNYLNVLISKQLPLRKIEAAFLHAVLANPTFGAVMRERHEQFLKKSLSWFDFILPCSEHAKSASHLYVATMHHLEKCQTLAGNNILARGEAESVLRFFFESVVPR